MGHCCSTLRNTGHTAAPQNVGARTNEEAAVPPPPSPQLNGPGGLEGRRTSLSSNNSRVRASLPSSVPSPRTESVFVTPAAIAGSSNPGILRRTHATHGQLEIRAEPATDGVRFALSLQPPSGDPVQRNITMYAENEDPRHDGRSTLGLSDITLPEAMRNKGIGGQLLGATAIEAGNRGIELVVIDNVVSGPMLSLCQRLGMREAGHGDFELEPGALANKCRELASQKDWAAAQD
jgi:hypothetical protein